MLRHHRRGSTNAVGSTAIRARDVEQIVRGGALKVEDGARLHRHHARGADFEQIRRGGGRSAVKCERRRVTVVLIGVRDRTRNCARRGVLIHKQRLLLCDHRRVVRVHHSHDSRELAVQVAACLLMASVGHTHTQRVAVVLLVVRHVVVDRERAGGGVEAELFIDVAVQQRPHQRITVRINRGTQGGSLEHGVGRRVLHYSHRIVAAQGAVVLVEHVHCEHGPVHERWFAIVGHRHVQLVGLRGALIVDDIVAHPQLAATRSDLERVVHIAGHDGEEERVTLIRVVHSRLRADLRVDWRLFHHLVRGAGERRRAVYVDDVHCDDARVDMHTVRRLHQQHILADRIGVQHAAPGQHQIAVGADAKDALRIARHDGVLQVVGAVFVLHGEHAVGDDVTRQCSFEHGGGD